MNEAYARLLRLVPQAAMLVQSDGLVLAANPAIAPIINQPPDAAVGRRFTDLVVDAAKAQSYLAACSASGQLIPGALTFRDGAEYRCDGALLEPRADSQPALLLLTLRPKQQSVAAFVTLNEKIAQLSRVRRPEHSDPERLRTRLVAALEEAGLGRE